MILESPLETARRHVREAETRVTAQREIVGRFYERGQDASLAELLLCEYETFLGSAVEQLTVLQTEHNRGENWVRAPAVLSSYRIGARAKAAIARTEELVARSKAAIHASRRLLADPAATRVGLSRSFIGWWSDDPGED